MGPYSILGAPLRQSLNPVTGGCFTHRQDCRFTKGRMSLRIFQGPKLARAAAAAALLAAGAGLAGCASIGDGMSTAFADPAKYQLYDCKQLEAERKNLATRAAELEGLIEKAQAGVAGPVVAEIAYRNEAISVQGQRKFAEEAWKQNKCHPSPPAAAAATPAATAASIANATGAKPAKGTQAPPRSGSAVY
jgi:hypothetical protein